jgi:hypothetical protein
MWASGHGGHIERAAHGYEPTREAAMGAFAKAGDRVKPGATNTRPSVVIGSLRIVAPPPGMITGPAVAVADLVPQYQLSCPSVLHDDALGDEHDMTVVGSRDRTTKRPGSAQLAYFR